MELRATSSPPCSELCSINWNPAYCKSMSKSMDLKGSTQCWISSYPIPSSGSHSETICTMLACSRLLIFFIRHASVARPLSESGKLRMARDMAELENAGGHNLFPVEQLDAPYRALCAFLPIIFLETDQLAGSPLLKDLPPNVILHHLYSRAPDELQSPLQSNQLTLKKYSMWLDSHREDHIWKGIKATLDDYEIKV